MSNSAPFNHILVQVLAILRAKLTSTNSTNPSVDLVLCVDFKSLKDQNSKFILHAILCVVDHSFPFLYFGVADASAPRQTLPSPLFSLRHAH